MSNEISYQNMKKNTHTHTHTHTHRDTQKQLSEKTSSSGVIFV